MTVRPIHKIGSLSYKMFMQKLDFIDKLYLEPIHTLSV
jgi:hypothetical protein